MNVKPKILMIGPDLNGKGGVATVVNQYKNNNLNKSVEWEYLTSAIDGNIMKKIVTFILSLIKLICIISRYDIVHIHMASRASFKRKRIIIYITKKVFKKKVIIHLHGAEFKEFYLIESNIHQKNNIMNTLNLADKIIALSDEWKEFIIQIVKEDNIKVIHNAVPIPSDSTNYAKSGIVFLGRLGKRKGVYDIIDAFRDIVDDYPDAHIHLAGDGEFNTCNDLCKKHHLDRNITLDGWVDQKRKEQLLLENSIFILPSYNEGLPMSMLEAMSYGLSVVVSDVGGIPSVIKNGENGVLIHAGNIKEIHNGLAYLIGNANDRKKLGQNARKTIIDYYSIQHHIDELLSIYYEFES